MAGNANNDGDPEFQVAPMIDVLLTLLVFFMTITSAQVLKADKKVRLPDASAAQKREKDRSEAVVNVRWLPKAAKAEFALADQTYANARDLAPAIKRLKANALGRAGTAPFRVVIRGDREAPTAFVSQAMDACSKAGVSDIAFSTAGK